MKKHLLLLLLLSFFGLPKSENSQEDNNDVAISDPDENITSTTPNYEEFKPGGSFDRKSFIKEKMKNFNNSTVVDDDDGPNSMTTGLAYSFVAVVGVGIIFLVFINRKACSTGTGTGSPASIVEERRPQRTFPSLQKDGQPVKYRIDYGGMRVPAPVQEDSEPSASRQSTDPSGNFASGEMRMNSGADSGASRETLEQNDDPIPPTNQPSTSGSHPSYGTFNARDFNGHHIDSGPSSSSSTLARRPRETLEMREMTSERNDAQNQSSSGSNSPPYPRTSHPSTTTIRQFRRHTTIIIDVTTAHDPVSTPSGGRSASKSAPALLVSDRVL